MRVLSVRRILAMVAIFGAVVVAAEKSQQSLPELRPRPGPPTEPSLPGVRCIQFHPSKLTLADVSKEDNRGGGNWLLKKRGQRPLFPQARDQVLDAPGILKVIKFYNMDASCWIDDPLQPFHFMLSNAKAPVGRMPGEDCIRHDHLTGC